MKKALSRPWVQRLCWIALLLLIWQCVVWSGRISPLLLPSLGTVCAELWQSLRNGALVQQIAFSLLVIAGGLAIALALAVLLCFGALRSKVLASLADTLCLLAHPLPAIALLPLIIVWFGIGAPAILAIIVHSALWPLLLNLLAGMRAVPSIYREMGRTLALGGWRQLWSISLPASFSYLLSGLKTGWARAWRALISAEMLFGAVGAHGGIGWYIFRSRVLMNTPGLFAGVLVVMGIGIAVDALLRMVERHTLERWGPA